MMGARHPARYRGSRRSPYRDVSCNPKGDRMAKDNGTGVADASAPDTDEWETVNTGSIGEEWDFDRDGPLTGAFLGLRTVPTQKVESGEATAIQFAPAGAEDTIVFVWMSEDLKAFGDSNMFAVGDRVKVSYLGRKSFNGADGKPRQLKQYRVQVPRQTGGAVVR